MGKIILSILIVCILVGRSDATPVRYTFSGQVSEIIIIHNEPPDEFGVLSIADDVTYEILIDDEQHATRTRFDGGIEVYPFSRGDYDYFFAEYLSGDLVSNETNQLSSTWYSPYNNYSIIQKNFGIIMNPEQPAIAGSFSVGTVDSEISLHMDSILGDSVSGIHEMLTLGLPFTMINTVRDEKNRWMSIKSEVFVTQTTPVAEPATIDIDPDTLNLKSKDKWITCYIELPEKYNVADIDVSTVAITSISAIGVDTAEVDIPAELFPTEIGDYNDNGILDFMVKFDRQLVQDVVPVGAVEITVSGSTIGEVDFQGTDTLLVIDKGKGTFR